MNINFTGHQIDLTDALRNFAEEKFSKLSRHFDRITQINVVFGVEKINQTAEATIHVPGTNLHAKAEAADVYAAVDLVIDKLKTQLTKYKEKLTNH